MIRVCLSAALVGALIGCAPETPSSTSLATVAKTTKITVECHGVGQFDIERGDSSADKACRAKLLNACPGRYYVTGGTVTGMTHTFEIACH